MVSLNGIYNCKAQKFTYAYDDNGNRVSRIFDSQRLANPADSIMEKDLLEKYSLDVYPNPVTESLNVAIYDLKPDSKVKISLYDPQGRIVYEANHIGSNSMINFSQYSVGIYFLEVKIDKQKISYRIQKN